MKAQRTRGGTAYKEHTEFPNQYGMMSKHYGTESNGDFGQVTDSNTGITEFWSTKHSESRYYDGRTKDEITAGLETELAAAKERIKVLRTRTGTNFIQADYEKLESAAGSSGIMTEEQAKILINDEFGFEASRIKILYEAEIDVTEEGSQYVSIKKVPRQPLCEATDWNYIRFNIRGRAAEWYYEMINAKLYEVNV
jgi:hypothetical protein